MRLACPLILMLVCYLGNSQSVDQLLSITSSIDRSLTGIDTLQCAGRGDVNAVMNKLTSHEGVVKANVELLSRLISNPKGMRKKDYEWATRIYNSALTYGALLAQSKRSFIHEDTLKLPGYSLRGLLDTLKTRNPYDTLPLALPRGHVGRRSLRPTKNRTWSHYEGAKRDVFSLENYRLMEKEAFNVELLFFDSLFAQVNRNQQAIAKAFDKLYNHQTEADMLRDIRASLQAISIQGASLREQIRLFRLKYWSKYKKSIP